MVKVYRSRVVVPLLVLLLLVPALAAQSADIPSQKPSVAASAGDASFHGEPRLLSRLEIFQAIQSDLARRGIRANGALRPDDLLIQSSVPVLDVNLGLIVKRIRYDLVRHETTFELWASAEPSYLPFEVRTRLDPHSLGLAEVLGWMPSDTRHGAGGTAQAASLVPSKKTALVKPGKAAILIIWGDNVRVTTSVTPLQSGFEGQSILVRDITTARVFTAVVVAAGLLQARL